MNVFEQIEEVLPVFEEGFASDPSGLEAAIQQVEELLDMMSQPDADAEATQGRALELFVEWPITSSIFRRFFPARVRGGMENPNDAAPPIEEQFAAMQLVRNTLLRLRPTTFDDEAAVYIESDDGSQTVTAKGDQ